MNSNGDREPPRPAQGFRPAESAGRLADEQLRLVWEHAEVGTILATAFALLLALNLHTSVNAGLVQAWLLLKIGVALPRIAQARIYRAKGFPGGPLWHRATYWLLALDGFVWGIAGLVVARDEISAALLTISSLACIAAVATFGLQVRVLATAAYVGPMIGLTALSLLARADRFGVFCGSGLLLFLALLISTAYRSQKRIAEVFLLRLDSARVAKEKSEAEEKARSTSLELAAALELAQRQSAVKSRFLATMSHELRTPLHGMLGLVRLLQADAGGETRRKLALIESSGVHLLQLINDVLDIGRIESGHLKIESSRFDLAAELERVVGIYAVRCADKELTLVPDLRLPSPCWVSGDAARLRQVFHNLLGNAVKFTDAGSILLRAELAEHGWFSFEVQDTGLGIAEADQPRVFDAFHQLGTASAAVEGTGLGLTIAREVARAMGGDITCRSEPGAGSSFRFAAPLEGVAADPPAAAASPQLSVAAFAARGARRVLVAEDNDVNALIVLALLAREGVDGERVTNGELAVERALAEGERPDLVLMDCRMPTLDGIEATRRIRAAERERDLPRIPVVALTATASEEDRRQCIAAGMDGFIAKPFTDAELAEALSRWLDRDDAAAPARSAAAPARRADAARAWVAADRAGASAAADASGSRSGRERQRFEATRHGGPPEQIDIWMHRLEHEGV